MNYKLTLNVLGFISLTVAGLMIIPFIMSFAYGETSTPLAFGVTILALVAVGIPATIFKPKNRNLSARGGFLIVALAWIYLSLMGALPFTISKYVPNYIDALFETISGFTTTGATILTNVEGLPKSLIFWRSFTHWIGGMGVLLFIIAVLPKSDPTIVHLIKAETPGPQFGKLVSKLRFSAQITYAIYIVLTLLEVVALACCGCSAFDSFVHALGTAGTGGFSSYNLSVAGMNSLGAEIVITVFMVIFSVNFNLYYLCLIGHFKDAIKSEELRTLIGIFAFSSVAISISLTITNTVSSFGEGLRYASFQTASIISTSGFATADYTQWPTFCQIVLFMLMFMGGSAGSTAGGLKVSRLIIMFKDGIRQLRTSISPNRFTPVKLDGKPVSSELTRGVTSYTCTYCLIMVVSLILISLNSPSGFGIIENSSAVVTCINNVGPGFGALGPLGTFAPYSNFTKIVLSLDMLIGRLEIVPILLLFYPKAWQRN